MIAGLTSVAELWRETYQRVEFQKPSAAFVERLIGKIALPIAQHHLDSTLTFSLRGALQLILMGEELDAAARLLATMSAHSERIASEVMADPGDPMLFGTEALVWLAAARTMQAAAAPDRALLVQAVEATLARLGKSRNIPVAGLARLQFAAYAALLSGDLDLFRRTMGLRKQVAHLPRQWAMLQSIASAATQSAHAGMPLIRCSDHQVCAEFMAMFQLHRQPSNQHVSAELGQEGLLAGGQLGGYVYAWIYLQSFASAGSAQSDWGTLGELLIG